MAAYAQVTPPFYYEIQAFKKADSTQMPPRNAVLFVGSSSIRLWDSLPSYFPKLTVIQRGVGGASLTDIIRYQADIIDPYRAKTIVLYAGENDFTATPMPPPDTVANRAIALMKCIRKNNRHSRIIYISIKPSPSRQALMPYFLQTNNKIAQWMAAQRDAVFVNIVPVMLSDNKAPDMAIFKTDSLHMNASGYRLWQKELIPYLSKHRLPKQN